jgi:hypothetical protein
MTKYEFTLIVKDGPELTEEIADRLFSSGCDDGSPGVCCGLFSIDFHREADSLEKAIASAIRNVRSAGLETERVEIRSEAVPQSA